MSETAGDSDPEIILAHGSLRLRVAAYGASLRGLWRESTEGAAQADIIAGYSGKAGKMGGQGDVLIPFPGRVRAGTYAFEGTTYAMPINDKDGPNAIHGFLRTVVWTVEEQSAESVRFAVDLRPDEHPGYPFSLHATVTYTVDADGLTVRFTLTNTGAGNAPVAAGFHPYFTVGSEWIDSDLLHVPMASTLEFENLLPTGKLLPVDFTALDFRSPHPIDDVKLNHCYASPARDLDGKLRINLAKYNRSHSLIVWMDEAFNYVVLYTGDPMPDTHRRRALAIEPMTGGSDAFNHGEFGLTILAPGATLTGAWGVCGIH